MANLCVIPARGGSKRIPRKNIKDFLGKPIIAYSIEVALQSGLFDEVMVSTDDEEIAEVALRFGGAVPFLRSTENSDDFSGTGDVVEEVLKKYLERGETFKFACCIYATAPFVSEARLSEGYDLLIGNEFDAVFPLAKYSSPIWRSYNIDHNKAVIMNFPENETKRSQDLTESFYDAGQFYWIDTERLSLLDNKNAFGVNKAGIVLNDWEVQDIDNMEDWEIAELKYKFLQTKSNHLTK